MPDKKFLRDFLEMVRLRVFQEEWRIEATNDSLMTLDCAHEEVIRAMGAAERSQEESDRDFLDLENLRHKLRFLMDNRSVRNTKFLLPTELKALSAKELNHYIACLRSRREGVYHNDAFLEQSLSDAQRIFVEKSRII